MAPTYSHGDYVFAAKWPYMSLKQGDVVIVEHGRYGVIVKRVSKVLAKGKLSLHGDNSTHSVSSQDMGQVDKQTVLGKVLTSFNQ